MNEIKIKICPLCKTEMKRQYNSSIYGCPKCESERRIAKNKTLLAQSFSSTSISPRNGSKKPKKKTPRQCAMDRADEWFSRYIRMKYSFESGGQLYCKCYTCGNIKSILEIQNGHWQRRGYKTTRFHPNDARPQCVRCNYHRSGEPEKFEINLIRDIGQDAVNDLKKLAQETGEDNELFYREQAAKFRKLTNQLIKEKGINPFKS